MCQVRLHHSTKTISELFIMWMTLRSVIFILKKIAFNFFFVADKRKESAATSNMVTIKFRFGEENWLLTSSRIYHFFKSISLTLHIYKYLKLYIWINLSDIFGGRGNQEIRSRDPKQEKQNTISSVPVSYPPPPSSLFLLRKNPAMPPIYEVLLIRRPKVVF